MKVYKVTLMIIDFDEVGDDIKDIIENARYPNRCISPTVYGMESMDIGEWEDENPLNNHKEWKAEFRRLFEKREEL